MTDPENPHAGQGPVMLDIGGEIGALVVLMPAGLEGHEIEIRPAGLASVAPAEDHGHPHDHGHAHDHGHEHGHEHGHDHVAVVNRPVGEGTVSSLVYPTLEQGDYVLVPKGGGAAYLQATVVGGQVTTVDWPTGLDPT